uniref:DNL-type domain-containing protein n=1 Tax=Dunaliella tertiolecta TaxID=3047 RepID=A0A7S3RAK1_DUNTE|mmetsp:Transcript_6686/g.16037  ORF Transcript_6686/g.16037 Transcript_6686/m.16037 type:complete len:284 (-) Transcript_6686:979-1830(-)
MRCSVKPARPACAPSRAALSPVATQRVNLRRFPTCSAASQDPAFYSTRILPSNTTWLLSFVQDRFYSVHGSDFVIKRGEESEEQARPCRGKSRRMLAPQRPCDKHADMVHKAVWQAPPIQLMLEGGVVDVDVDLDGLMETYKEEEVPSAPATTCTGIVSVTPASNEDESTADGQEGIYVTGSASPRRTKVVGFTCLKCGARNHKAVNPKSYLSGTLVCQCGKCSRKHIVTDHLKLFSLYKLDGSMRKASKGPESEVRLSEDDIPASMRNVDFSVLEQSVNELN